MSEELDRAKELRDNAYAAFAAWRKADAAWRKADAAWRKAEGAYRKIEQQEQQK